MPRAVMLPFFVLATYWLRVALGCQPAPRVEGLGRDQRRKE
jgi:hypothetical protein